MENETLTTTQAKDMTAAELRAFALTVPCRQLSLFCTRYAAAKDADVMGDKAGAAAFLESAKVSYRRHLEDEHGRLARVRATAAVVAANGDSQSPTAPGGKHVVKLAMGKAAAVWQESWTR